MNKLESFYKEAKKYCEEGFSLQCLSVVDELKSFRLCYFLTNFNLQNPQDKKIEVEIERREPRIKSLISLWPSLNWHEREAYDLFGIYFEDHPDLRRILCAENWVGYPLRKDYLPVEEYEGIKLYPDEKMNFSERFCE